MARWVPPPRNRDEMHRIVEPKAKAALYRINFDKLPEEIQEQSTLPAIAHAHPVAQ